MHKLKQIPEDFIVKEINNIKLDSGGNYSYFLLKKKNLNTLNSIKLISKKLRIPEQNIGFSGNKDKNAITEQTISIKNSNNKIKNIRLKNIELEYIGNGNKEVFLGSHKGNEFIIVIRNLTGADIKNVEGKIKNNEILMPNFFGEQRLSRNNADVGRALVKKDFKKATKLILETNSDCNKSMEQHLGSKNNDFVGALKAIPLKLLKLYVHSYQSYLFNKTLETYSKNNKKIIHNNYNEKIPIIGFGTENKNEEIEKIINNFLEKEKLSFRDFIIPQIPQLSSEGDERKAFIKINDFKIIKKEKDELNENKEKLVVNFSLPKGCYATVLIDFLFKRKQP